MKKKAIEYLIKGVPWEGDQSSRIRYFEWLSECPLFNIRNKYDETIDEVAEKSVRRWSRGLVLKYERGKAKPPFEFYEAFCASYGGTAIALSSAMLRWNYEKPKEYREAFSGLKEWRSCHPLRIRRKSLKISQDALDQGCGVRCKSTFFYEAGKRYPNFAKLQLLADGVAMSAGALYEAWAEWKAAKPKEQNEADEGVHPGERDEHEDLESDRSAG